MLDPRKDAHTGRRITLMLAVLAIMTAVLIKFVSELALS